MMPQWWELVWDGILAGLTSNTNIAPRNHRSTGMEITFFYPRTSPSEGFWARTRCVAAVAAGTLGFCLQLVENF